MRIAFLGNGMTGYLDAQYRELHRLGHELLVVQPGSPDVAVGAMRDTAFGDLGVADYAEHVSWSQPPVARDLVARVARFAPDAVVMTAWNFDPAYRATMRAQPSGVVRIMVMDNLWRSTPRQWLARATGGWVTTGAPMGKCKCKCRCRCRCRCRRRGSTGRGHRLGPPALLQRPAASVLS